jgi:hypothetical protein
VYHFDEGSGTRAADSAGGNNGTLQGTPLPGWVVPGRIGAGALSFSGDGVPTQPASESAVKLTTNLAPVLGSTSTLSAWVKTTQIGSDTHWQAPAITGVEQAGGSDDIFWGTLNASGRIGIYVGDSGGVYSTNPINNGQWHNVVMTRDANTGRVQLYVDGVLDASGTFEAGDKTSQFSTLGALTDVASDGVTRNGNNYFNGQLDEVRVYNQVLGAGEIAGLARAPDAPTLLSATASPGPVVHLAWTAPSALAQSVVVDRKTGPGGTYATVATLAGAATSFDDTDVTPGAQYFYTVRAIDLAGSSPRSNELSVTVPVATIVANSVFYNGSKYDGQNGSSNLTDTGAVAPDKEALLPGRTPTFSNVTSYSKGINGVIIDVANLDNLPRFEDFSFRVGTDGDPAQWAVAPAPTYINTYPGRGPGGSTQITIIWDDNAIQNQWLQVGLLANDHTRLPSDDVFYFGNLIGETNGDGRVNALDLGQVKRLLNTDAAIDSPVDFNRDGRVNALDLGIVKRYLNQTLTPVAPPPLPPPAAPTAASAEGFSLRRVWDEPPAALL